MTTKRLITAMELPGITPGTPPTKTPEVTWIDPSDLLVDESYQRGIGEKGVRLIRKIVEHFDWRKFKPPTAVWTDDGLEVLDGQHSAIAAASHPGVGTIPVVIVEASDVKDRASAFIGINRDRLNVTMMQIHAAGIVSGDQAAMQIEAVCQSAGVRILKTSPSNGEYQPRDTVAVRAIGELIRRRGPVVASDIMKAVAGADLAPVTAAAIKAADFLTHDKEHAETFDPRELTKAIVALGAQADKDAGVFAAEHCVPKWRGLAAVWFKKTRKRRTRPESDTAGPDAPSEPSPSTIIMPLASSRRVIDRRALGPVNLGDPPPGRSALDQRRA